MKGKEIVKDYWVVLSIIVSMIVWYANVNSRLNAVEASETTQQTTIDKVNQIQVDVAVIKQKSIDTDTSLKTISKQVNYLVTKTH